MRYALPALAALCVAAPVTAQSDVPGGGTPPDTSDSTKVEAATFGTSKQISIQNYRPTDKRGLTLLEILVAAGLGLLEQAGLDLNQQPESWWRPASEVNPYGSSGLQLELNFHQDYRGNRPTAASPPRRSVAPRDRAVRARRPSVPRRSHPRQGRRCCRLARAPLADYPPL